MCVSGVRDVEVVRWLRFLFQKPFLTYKSFRIDKLIRLTRA